MAVAEDMGGGYCREVGVGDCGGAAAIMAGVAMAAAAIVATRQEVADLPNEEKEVNGARPMRRWLEERVVNKVVELLLQEEIEENLTVHINADGNKLTFRIEKNGGLVNAASPETSERA